VYRGTGKRKTSVARVRLIPGAGLITVNGRGLDAYFTRTTDRVVARAALSAAGLDQHFDVIARIHGGGVTGQAGALRLGIARSLQLVDPANRPTLKRAGFLTRDPRATERKKAGLKKARKAPQYSKR
jgi:small subunit ribosomal protein S9